MPTTKLTPERRRELTLAALSGEPKKAIAERFGVSLQRVYQLEDEARSEAGAELEFWRRVVKLAR